jgi:hypothetical protein
MSWQQFRRTFIKLCLALLLGLFLSGLPMQVMAQQLNIQVPDKLMRSQPYAWLVLRVKNERRLPGRREPAAGRGCGIGISNPPLTALSPESNLGFTVAAYPKFFFYIPQTSAKQVKFTLLKADKHKIYQSTFGIPSTPGIVSLSLPADKTLPPLEVGTDYHWYLQPICPEPDLGVNYVDGWIQRVESRSIPTSQLEQIPSSGQASRGGKSILWFDALAALAEKRQAHPGDLAIASEWANLLRSEGLDKIAQKPLVGTLANVGS